MTTTGTSGLFGPRPGFTVEEGLRHLVDAARDVLRTLETDRMLEVLMDRVVAMTRADRGFLMLRDDQQRLAFRIGRGFDQASLQAEEATISRSVAEEVFRSGRPILSANAPGDEALRNRRSVLELRLQTVMCAPLLARGDVLGILYVDSSRVRASFDQNGFAVFQALADLASIALENARLYALATTDAKTGVANAGLFQVRLEEAMDLAHRRGYEVALILADLDHFKRINDQHGHPVGDDVIRGTAAVLRSQVRPDDLVARVGGEEFAVLLLVPPGARSTVEPVLLAERMRRRLAEHPFPLPGGGRLAVTGSFGVSRFPGPGVETSADLVAAADRALYEAKRGGRDRVAEAGLAAIAV